jgi:hypothetical protein
MPPRARSKAVAPAPARPTAKPAVKHFGPSRDVAPAPVIPFSVGFVRAGVEEPHVIPFSVGFVRGEGDNAVEETHEFDARPRVSYGDTIGLIRGNGSNEDDAKALKTLDRSIRRMLVDDDGTPARWTPTFTGKTFEGPDGNTYPVSELNTFTAFDAGSSRRRWVALMDDDDETLSVEVGQVLEVFEYITEQAAEQAAAAS